VTPSPAGKIELKRKSSSSSLKDNIPTHKLVYPVPGLNLKEARDKYNQQHKVEIEYSEGESGSEFIIKIRNLKPKAKLQRIVFLWNKAFTRSKAATKIINSF
jgi:hypothetical protein